MDDLVKKKVHRMGRKTTTTTTSVFETKPKLKIQTDIKLSTNQLNDTENIISD